MAWTEVTFFTTPESIEQTAAVLTAAGYGDLIVENQREYEAFLEENRDCWDYIDDKLRREMDGLCQIRLYLDTDDRAGLERVKKIALTWGLIMVAEPLPDIDWSEQSREQYPPQAVGEKLMILPCWLAEQDTGGRIPVILNPGLTFGTGFHPSTRLALRKLEELVRPGCRCLDLGSGSGILSLAALRLGAGSAEGVDIDPKARDAARENAGLNGFAEPKAVFCTGDILRDQALAARLVARPCDLVMVNIVADVILALAPSLPRLTKKDGRILCSGILDTRLAEVCAGLEKAGLTVEDVSEEAEWRCVTARRADA